LLGSPIGRVLADDVANRGESSKRPYFILFKVRSCLGNA
jgi:hypothetical protein